MKKFPASPDLIIKDYTADWQAAFGHDLEAIILYGSGARGAYVAGKSDINFLVIVSPAGMSKLRQAAELTEKWRQQAVATPLLLTRDYIHASLDSFPIEFLNLQRHHRVVFGQDLLADLTISPQNLRLQLEREIKGKLLHLREGLLGAGDNRDALQNLLARSLKDFSARFEALLFLKSETIPPTRKEVFQKAAHLAHLDGGFIEKLFRLSESTGRAYRDELWQLAESYITQIEKLSIFIDQM